MDLTEAYKTLAQTGNDGLYNTLGMEFVSTDDPDTCMARMPVDKRHVQQLRYLCGGATLALAEIVAGVGSFAVAPDRDSFGMNVSCSHIRSVPEGQYVTALARIIHRGRHTHVWHVEVLDEQQRIVSSVTVTNYISLKK